MLRKNNGGSGGPGMKDGGSRPRPKLHTGSLSSGTAKAWNLARHPRTHNSLSSMGLASCLAQASEAVDPEYVMQLVSDVRGFADVLLSLRDAFQDKENQDGLQQLVQERLAELLRVLKGVIGKHPTLNSVDILGTAGSVIAKTKAINFQELNPDNSRGIFAEIRTSIDNLAFTFGNVVSDFLMGDVDSGSGLGIPQTRRSRSFDNLSVEPEAYVPEKDQITGPELPLTREEEVDLALLKTDGGVESALLYAKAWSKYIKDLLAWMEKRVSLDMEYAKSYAKMAESARNLASQQDFMPFSDIYVSSFNHDVEFNQLLLHSAAALHTNKFIQPLLARKNELDRLRKDIKEQWQREQKKMHEAHGNLRKAQAMAAQRREEYGKARSSSSRSQEEQPGNRQLEKKRRLEEEALQKAEEAQDQYQSCVADAGVRRMDLANAKSTALTQIREMVFQCDLTLKAVTVNWFQMQQSQTEPLPTRFQTLSENAKLYEPGQCYSDFVRKLPRKLPKDRLHSDSMSSDNARLVSKRSVGSTHSSHGNLSQASVSGDELDGRSAAPRSDGSGDTPGPAQLRAWASSSQGGMCSDSESAGGSSESRSMDSPSASPGDLRRRLPRTPSTGTMSSADDLDEREAPSHCSNGLAEMVTETASSPGPYRNAHMSKAAQTHRLRKLRAPSKCRECDSLVMFHGAECEECSLACHKKCLETLAIQCGHKKLQGKLQLFGISFAQASKNRPDGIPFIINKCTAEIESRALSIKGIYRVNGAKSRVEKLCQAFENGKELVELSELSPHDISNVLKLYLRQLPEPLILYRYYNDFIGLAKEYQRVMVEQSDPQEPGAPQGRSHPSQEPGAPLDRSPLAPEALVSQVVLRIRDLLRQLPAANYKTLRHLIAHLNRVAEQSEDNKMTASNLGIIFGPTLVKPRQADAQVSLSSLVDYPYQALMVELLVRHFPLVFDPAHLSPAHPSSPQEKLQRLGRHSASMMDVKENTKVYKRFSSVIPSSQILNEVQEVQPGSDRTHQVDGLNGDAPKSSLAYGRHSVPVSSAPKVQLRPPRTRQSRPVSMPLERLPASRARSEPEPADQSIPELTEPEKAGPVGASRISTYYITPFLDTQALQKKTWDRKYRHYDVTPRTAMIVANLPSGSSVAPEPSVRGPEQSSPLTLRAPRTLQPPPGTFYNPPACSRARTLPTWTTTVTSVTTTTVGSSLALTSALPESASSARLQDSMEPGVLAPPDNPGETKHVYQRLRPRRLPELEPREAHFV